LAHFLFTAFSIEEIGLNPMPRGFEPQCPRQPGLASGLFFCFPSCAMNPNQLRRFRALLVLARVPNLPAVWSNCLAGWWLGGGGNAWKLPLLLFGASALWAGGTFLNDAFDAEFDRQNCPSRPIPSGAISRESVWVWSFGLLAAGALALALLGKTDGVMALALLASIVIYNAAHRGIAASPWLLGLCRLWIYIAAGAIGAWGVNGWPIWCGAALTIYVAGIGHIARRDHARGPVPFWPLLPLAAPVVLAMLLNTGAARASAGLVALVLVVWAAWCVRAIFQTGEVTIARIVPGLLAGIIFVDWLAVAPQLPHPVPGAILFLSLFGAAQLLRRFAPGA
jgi:hypothetical protein